MAAWAPVLVLGGMVLFAFALRQYRLDAQSLWSDEGLSIYRASQDVGFILTNRIIITGVASPDTHPPLYFLVLHAFIAGAGRGEFAVKWLSVLFSILSIPLLAVTARRLFGPGAGLLAALFGTISPVYLWYAQELRMYTMVVFLGLVSAYSLWRVLESLAGGARLRSTGPCAMAYLLATAALLYTHYSGFFLLAFEGLAVVVFAVRWRRVRLLAVLVAAALASTPLLPVALARLRGGAEAAYSFVPLPIILQDLTNAFSLGVTVNFDQVVWLDVIFLGVFLLGIAAALLRPDRRAAGLFILGYALVPPLVLYLASTVKPMYLGVRHLIVVSPAFYVGLAAGLDALRARWRPVFVACLVLFAGGVAYSTYNAFFSAQYTKDDVRSLTRYVESHVQPGDLILLRDPVISITFDYYYRGGAPWQALPRYNDRIGPATYATLEQLTRQYKRIWMVYGPGGFFEDPDDRVHHWLDQNLYKIDNETFHGFGAQVAVAAYLTTPPFMDELPPEATPAGARVGGLALLGYDVPNEPPAAGTTSLVNLYWRVEQRERENYKFALRLVDAAGNIWGAVDQFPFGGEHGTSGWKPGPIIRAGHDLAVSAGTPPGRYRLVLAAYESQSGKALDIASPDGQSSGPERELGVVEVVGGPAPAGFRPERPADAAWQTGVRLAGYEVAPQSLRPGEIVVAGLYFAVDRTQPDDLHVRVELLDGAGSSRGVVEAPPAGDGYPARAWQPGDFLKGQYRLTVSPDAPAGDTHLRVTLLDAAGRPVAVRSGWWPVAGDNFTLPAVRVQAIERSTHLPSTAQPVPARLGEAIELLGYDGAPSTVRPGDTISTTLYWRATAAVPVSYKATVQLISGDNQVLAQQDGVPANWTRPTTGWLPGEVVADPHGIAVPADIPPGEYRLIVALYEEGSGQRLLVRQDGGERDYVVLGRVEVKR